MCKARGSHDGVPCFCASLNGSEPCPPKTHTDTHTHTREDLHKCKKDVVKPPVGCERDLPDDVVVKKKPPLCFSETLDSWRQDVLRNLSF